jgi:hypothetical protein
MLGAALDAMRRRSGAFAAAAGRHARSPRQAVTTTPKPKFPAAVAVDLLGRAVPEVDRNHAVPHCLSPMVNRHPARPDYTNGEPNHIAPESISPPRTHIPSGWCPWG